MHRHSTAPIHASTNLVSVFAVKVFMPAGRQTHSGGDGFDVRCHVVKTRSARGTETPRGGRGEAGGRGEWAAESPALAHSNLSSTPGRCAPLIQRGPGLQRRPPTRQNDGTHLCCRLQADGGSVPTDIAPRFQLCFTARSADAPAALTACCQTEPSPLLNTHCQILTAFTFGAVNGGSCAHTVTSRLHLDAARSTHLRQWQ